MTNGSIANLYEIVSRLAELEAARDSLEIGTPGKGGLVKVYVNFEDVEKAKAKVNRAFDIRAYAQQKMLEEGA